MQNNLISIVIPVYNAEKWVKNAIDSVLNQTYKNLEILICDDASNDKSYEILRTLSDERIRLFRNDVNQGYLKTCNFLFSKTNGDYIGFQDADDWSNTDRIMLTLNEFDKDTDLMLCGTNFYRKHRNKRIVSNYPLEYEKILDYINSQKTAPFCGATVVFKKEIYDKIGGFKEFFNRKGYEDIDWILRVSEKFKIKNIKKELYLYNYDSNSVSRISFDVDFKKFFIKDIAWFLKLQRDKNHGIDALSSNLLNVELENYLTSLESKFHQDKSLLIKRVFNNLTYNCNFKGLFLLLIREKIKKNLSFLLFFNLIIKLFYRYVKCNFF